MMGRRGMWIDTDLGFDDIAAIAMVLASPDHQIAGVGLVAGNAPLDQVIRNAFGSSALFGWALDWHAGATAPLREKLVTADYVLGETGIRTAGRSLPVATGKLASGDAVAAMQEWLSTLPEGSGDILALGPLTNIAQLVSAGRFLDRIGRIVLMGGSTDRGNHTAAAEFNIAVDPEAADIVFSAGLRTEMVGLNACREVPVIADDVHWMRGFSGIAAQTMADMLEGYLSIRSADLSRPMPLFDPLAAAALVAPELVTLAPARVDVELEGRLTRGMTVCELRVPQRADANARVAVGADSDGVRRLLRAALQLAVSG
ncbi:nucleoside hydrolase [Radicibacter daui]|uniref:nucleoside hydrolase n=1 Tax=Radicibacter daui TaxID=3064829 RepID=UPI004046CDE3